MYKNSRTLKLKKKNVKRLKKPLSRLVKNEYNGCSARNLKYPINAVTIVRHFKMQEVLNDFFIMTLEKFTVLLITYKLHKKKKKTMNENALR